MTTMLMDIGMDTGAMLLKSHQPIDLFTTAHDLAVALSQQSAELIVKTLPQLASGTITPIPQDAAQATYASLIQKHDYELDWQRSALALHNQVRGFYPSCFTQFREQGLKITETVPLTTAIAPQLPTAYGAILEQLPTDAQPGTIAAIVKHVGVVVQTGDGGLLLKQVQPAGKKAQSGWDFANGMRVVVGETLQ